MANAIRDKISNNDHPIIDGVIIKKLNPMKDDRGWLCEVYRKDEESKASPAMCYSSYSKYGVIRGPHEHMKQSDFFVFTGPGDFELYLWDNRKDSKTYGKSMKLIVGENNKISVLVPPGVVHGYKAVSRNGSFYINLPDQLYRGKRKKEDADEIRHENNKNSRFKIS